MGLLDYFKVTHLVISPMKYVTDVCILGGTVADDALPFLPSVPIYRTIKRIGRRGPHRTSSTLRRPNADKKHERGRRRSVLPPMSDYPLTPFTSPPPPQTAFWRDDRLQQVMPVLVALVAPAGAAADQGASSSSSPGVVVSAGLVALCGAATDDGLLKRLNLDVLMHTRAEDARVRIVALRCARALWAAHGSKLIGA